MSDGENLWHGSSAGLLLINAGSRCVFSALVNPPLAQCLLYLLNLNIVLISYANCQWNLLITVGVGLLMSQGKGT